MAKKKGGGKGKDLTLSNLIDAAKKNNDEGVTSHLNAACKRKDAETISRYMQEAIEAARSEGNMDIVDRLRGGFTYRSRIGNTYEEVTYNAAEVIEERMAEVDAVLNAADSAAAEVEAVAAITRMGHGGYTAERRNPYDYYYGSDDEGAAAAPAPAAAAAAPAAGWYSDTVHSGALTDSEDDDIDAEKLIAAIKKDKEALDRAAAAAPAPAAAPAAAAAAPAAANVSDRDRLSALFRKCRFGDPDSERSLKELCDGFKHPREPNGNLLHYLVLMDDLSGVIFMVEKCRADVNVTDNDGRTALHLLARTTQTIMMKYIVAIGGNLHAKDVFGHTAEEVAKKNKRREAELLLKKVRSILDDPGNNLNAYDAVQLAERKITQEQKRLEEFLAKNGFDPKGGVDQVRPRDGARPLDVAITSEDLENVRFLVEKCGADPNIELHTGIRVLKHAIYEENITAVEKLIEYGADVNYQDERRGKACALLDSVQLAYPEAVRALLEAGANPNLKLEKDEYPLSIAIEKLDLDCVRELLAWGADHELFDMPELLNADPASRDAVVNVVEEHHRKIHEFLRDNGFLRDYDSETPTTLLSVNENGDTPLHAAVRLAEETGDETMVRVFLHRQHGYSNEIKLSTENNDSETAISLALKLKLKSTAKYLMDGLMQSGLKFQDGTIRLAFSACMHGYVDILRRLRSEHDVDLRTIIYDQKDAHLIHKAASCKNINVVEFLVKECGVDVNARDNEGYTALHILAIVDKEQLDNLAFIVSIGADVDIADKNGVTAEEIAEASGNVMAEKFLREFKSRFDTKYQALVNPSTEDINKLRCEVVADVMNDVMRDDIREAEKAAVKRRAELEEREAEIQERMRRAEEAEDRAKKESEDAERRLAEANRNAEAVKARQEELRKETEEIESKAIKDLIINKPESLGWLDILFKAAKNDYGPKFIGALKKEMESKGDDIANYINEKNTDGLTPSHVAADSMNRRAAIALFLVGKANPKQTDDEGRTVSQAMEEFNEREAAMKRAAPGSDVARPEGGAAAAKTSSAKSK